MVVLGRTRARAPRMMKKLLNSNAVPSSVDRPCSSHVNATTVTYRAETGLISPLEHQ